MKSTFSFIATAVIVGILAGAAVGYWEARPWVGPATVPAAKNHEHDHDHAHEHNDAHPEGDANSAPQTSRDGAVSEGPSAAAPETTFKFGNMESGTEQRHEFPLRNEGGQPLVVNYVSHTCKCTEVQLNGTPVEPGASVVVQPGEAATILLVWAAKSPPGPFRHGASFTTNDPANPRVEITVEGEIVESTTLEPSELVFGSVHVDQGGTAEVAVMSFIEPTVEILSHDIEPAELAEHVKIEMAPLLFGELPNPTAKAGVKIVATYDPRGMLGPFAGTLNLVTNVKQAERLVVPIQGNVKGDISIFSPLLNQATGLLRLGSITAAQGGGAKLFLNIRGAHAADTQVTVESVTPPELQATLGEREPLREGLVRIPLNVSVPPGTRPLARMGEDQGGEGEIVLATTHPGTSHVRVRVHFTVQP